MHKLVPISTLALAFAAGPAGSQVVWPLSWDGDNSPVLIVNGTGIARSYALISTVDPAAKVDLTRHFTLPSGAACRLDTGLYLHPPQQPEQERFVVTAGLADSDHASTLRQVTQWGEYVEDVSEGPRGVMNAPLLVRYDVPHGGFVIRDPNVAGFTACSAMGLSACAGTRWGSWKVALMVPSSQRFSYDEWLLAGFWVWVPAYVKSARSPVTVEMRPDHLYWPRIDWQGQAMPLILSKTQPKALVLIQNGLDGQGTDDIAPWEATLRSRMAFGEAPLCSQYPES